jgi:acetyl-CoA acetyltransferase
LQLKKEKQRRSKMQKKQKGTAAPEEHKDAHTLTEKDCIQARLVSEPFRAKNCMS